jgi:ADP-ribose pyrophosphatase
MDRDKDVEIIVKETPFQGYFRIDRYRLRHRLFAGGMGRPIRREVFERGHAVALLPYDPVLDQVVLIEQFRIGAYAAGRAPWLVEIVAGIIEAGETADDVARRETQEEAGLTIIGELEPIAEYLASPGASTETVAVFCGRVDASRADGIHGHADEGEDIRVLAMPVDDALARLAAGKIDNSPGIIALQWLALNRERLRRKWLGD